MVRDLLFRDRGNTRPSFPVDMGAARPRPFCRGAELGKDGGREVARVAYMGSVVTSNHCRCHCGIYRSVLSVPGTRIAR
jgi:hypothetical protein